MNHKLLPLFAGLIVAIGCLGSPLWQSPLRAADDQNEVRTWTASNGKFQTQAKLVEVRPDAVVLEKSTGSKITVPRDRLSESDRAYLDARQAAPAAKKQKSSPADEAMRREVRAELARASEAPPVLTFEKVSTLQGHAAPVVAVAISGDGSRVITCAENGDCRAWDLKTGRQVAKFEKPLEGKSFCVAITPDGRRGLVGGEFKMVHVWDTQTGKILFSHDAAKSAIAHVTTSADGQQMLAAAANGTILRFPILGGKGFAGSFHQPEMPVDHFAAAPDASCALSIFNHEIAAELGVFPRGSWSGTHVQFTLSFPRATSAAISAHYMAFGSNIGRFQMMRIPQVSPEKTDSTYKYFWVDSRLASSEQMTITSDEQFIISADREGRVEIRDVVVPGDPASFRIPVADVTSIATGADGMTIVFGHRAGSVSVWRLPKVPSPPKARFLRMAFGYLRQRQYDRLDALAAEVGAQKVPLSHWCGSSQYGTVVGCLMRHPGVSDPAWNHDQELKTWLDRRPESSLAKIVVAQRLINLAWEARGTGYAPSVSEEGWRGFQENLTKAKAVLVPLVASPDTPGDAYRLLFTIAKGEGWERSQVDQYVEQMMRHWPAEFGAHEAVAEMLMPRWGGEPGDSEAYARSIADRVGGAAGAAIYARVAVFLATFYRPQEFAAVEKFDYPRIREGFAEICRQCPDDPEPVNGAMKMAWVYRDKETAKQCVAKLEARGEPWSFRHWVKYVNYLNAKNWATTE
jgi:WD40 repeat protein